MKARPILFSGEMVRALLAGRKTQTRRVCKGAALDWLVNARFTPEFTADSANDMCPYGKIGDLLYVRERFAIGYDATFYHADGEPKFPSMEVYPNSLVGKWKPSMRFKWLWHSVNGEESWDDYPWVWVISFKVHQRNVQFLLQELNNGST